MRLAAHDRQQVSEKPVRSIPTAKISGYQDLSYFQRSATVDTEEFRHISDLAMKFEFLRMTVCFHESSANIGNPVASNLRHQCLQKRS